MKNREPPSQARRLLGALPEGTPIKDIIDQGVHLRDQGRHDKARLFFDAALLATKRHPEVLNHLGQIEIALGDLPAAIKVFAEAVQRDPKHFSALYNLAYAYEMAERFPEAEAAYRRALALVPAHGWAALRLGNCLNILGRQAEALACFRQAATAMPQRPRPLANIAAVDPSALDQQEIALLEKIASLEGPPGRIMGACFALGDLYDFRKDYDRAFAHYAKGNALRLVGLGTDGDQEERGIAPPDQRQPFRKPEEVAAINAAWIARAKEVFTPESLKSLGHLANDSALPIFIVGLPRSGSTLVEQILAAHPRAHGAGEVDHFGKLVINGRWPYWGDPAAPQAIPPGAFDALRRAARAYLERLRQLAPDAKRVVNKMLANYLYIGLIHVLYPRATILHTLRHPLDTALGGFRKLFGQANETTYDLVDLGNQYLRYRDMMTYWERLLPGRVFHVVHEDLVADQEGMTRRILTACGLPWDERCLRFFEKDRAVRTASQAQVRQPITADRLERWRRYERHLGPLIETIGARALETWRPEQWATGEQQ